MTGSGRNKNRNVLKAIRAIVGPSGMKRLYAEKGGIEICIPRKCDADHWMSIVFGEDLASKLCEHFAVFNADGHLVGGVRCYVPIKNSIIAAAHEEVENQIKAALLSGKSVYDTTREVGVSARKVRDYLKYLRKIDLLPTPPKPHVKPGLKGSLTPPAGAGAKLIRRGRKHLLVTGRPVGGDPSSDHSANVGAMVPPDKKPRP